MKNIRETVNNALIIGGLVSSGVAVGDVLKNHATIENNLREREAITQQLEANFGIERTCFVTQFGNICEDKVLNARNKEEEKQKLNQFHSELENDLGKVPNNNKALLDSGLFTTGLVLTVEGLSRKKQE